MDSPAPEEYQPPLRLWSHLWRVAVMLVLSALVFFPAEKVESRTLSWWATADLLVGAVAYVVVFFRRRHPVTIAAVLSVLAAVSGVAGGPASLGVVSLATRRRWREIAAIGALSFASTQLFSTITASEDDPRWLILIANAIATAAMLAWGMYVGSRRELIWTLRSRAERAEAEQELRVSQARGNERARIAREMHDVLAHRISQISMHAGALAFRDDLSADEMRAGVGLIRERSHEALTDLRDVLGVLRDDTGETRSAPQPTYADLACLVDEAREAGMRVELEDLLADDEPPAAAGRTVYRIVQEGMTNARKHAPGAMLTVRVSGSPEVGVDVLLRNQVGFGPTQTPGAGLGLVGLTERAELRGGRLQARREGAEFVLHGWIPWGS